MDKTQISSAYWIGPSTGFVLLSENWHGEKLPPLELGSEKYVLTGLQKAPNELFGEISGFYVEGDQITFFSYADKCANLDRDDIDLYVAGDFNQWEKAVDDPKWKMQRGSHDGKDCFRLTINASDCIVGDSVAFKFVTSEHFWLPVDSNAPNVMVDSGAIVNYRIDPRQTGDHCFIFQVGDSRAISFEHFIIWDDGHHREEHAIVPGLFFYKIHTDLELGANIVEGKTVFRVFAPRANEVTVEIFKDMDDNNPIIIPMKLADQTTWEATHKEDLHGWYYYLRIDGRNNALSNFDPSMRVLDPYALATVTHAGPGIILDKKRIPQPPKKPYSPPDWQDLVILEAHVRDLIQEAPIDLTAEERKGFTGLKKWIKTKGNYIKKLGVNAVELQPVQQFDSDMKDAYHWGYMTTNYFSPSCWYSEHPEKASQIEEFRAVVDAFHEEGISVIIDVVYNHVGVPEFLLYIDKHYYFDLDPTGELINWSGCGNTTRAGAEMMQRLIIDSLKHFVEVFDVDGFRFDLAELIGVEVLTRIERELKPIKPRIILIAEPWSFRGHIAQNLSHTGYAFWNDGFRDFMAEYVGGSGNRDGIKYYLSGCISHLASFPAQSVNYVESHDDYCWIDKITENADHNGEHPTDNDIARSHMVVAIIMSSMGIPMISAGQDMLRSKKGVHNTYLRGDLNALDYSCLDGIAHTHEFFANWVKFRLSDEGSVIRLYKKPSDSYIRWFESGDNSAVVMVYNADLSNGENQVMFAVNPHEYSVRIETQEYNSDNWVQVADHLKFGEGLMESFHGHAIELQPLSTALWVNKKKAAL